MQDRPEFGIYLRDTRPMLDAVKRLYVASSELVDVEQALPRRDRVTVFLCNHGPMVAPFPAPVLTVDHLLEVGGYDELVAVTLFHWIVETSPLISRYLTRYFGHSTRELRSMKGIVEMMRQRRFNIIGTAPEGSSCTMLYDDPVGPFTRCGLIVAALKAGADIVLAAQKGVEGYGRRLRFPGGLRLPFFDGPVGLQLGVPPLKPAHITVKYLRYAPTIGPDEIEAATPDARRALLGAEVERLRASLNALYLSMD